MLCIGCISGKCSVYACPKSAVGSSDTTSKAGLSTTVYANPITGSGCIVNKIRGYIERINISNTSFGIYSDDGGTPARPLTLLASCTVSSPASAAWTSCTLDTPQTLANGTKYWLAATQTDSGSIWYVSAGGTNRFYSTGDGALDATWNASDSENTWKIAMEAFYE